jgi:hypothetical protein
VGVVAVGAGGQERRALGGELVLQLGERLKLDGADAAEVAGVEDERRPGAVVGGHRNRLRAARARHVRLGGQVGDLGSD